MKIAQVSGHFGSKYYSSNEQFLCRELAKLGHDVVVFTATKQPRWQTVKSDRDKNQIEKNSNFVVRRLPTGPEIGIIPLMPTLLSALMDEEFDIVHSHDFFTTFSFYSAIAARARRLPLIITQHNDQLPSFIINRFLYKFDGLTFGNFVLREANKIIALTEETRLHLLKMGASVEKIAIVPNAVDTKRFSPSNRNFLEERWGITDPVILFVGRLVKEKGVEYLLQAFSSVVKRIPEAKLVIVGKGPSEEELRALQARLCIPNVFFLGVVENMIMPNIYAGANVVVLPSIQEPFGNVALEAMASGKPVIGTYTGGMKDTIIHGVTGYHVQPGNSGQIYKFLLKILYNKSLQEELGENSRKRTISNYDTGLLIKKIEKIYLGQLTNCG